LFAVALRALQRRGLIGRALPRIRCDISRCTWEEARGLLQIVDSVPGRPQIVGVSDAPCPSAARASRYVRRPVGDVVIAPEQALARVSRDLSPEQRAFWNAVQPTPRERNRAALVEAPNWVVHALSEATRVVGLDPPLEARLARALRHDRR